VVGQVFSETAAALKKSVGGGGNEALVAVRWILKRTMWRKGGGVGGSLLNSQITIKEIKTYQISYPDSIWPWSSRSFESRSWSPFEEYAE
jgi:hypothetical protein